MRILIVKLSSLGDVVHSMPVVHDIRAAHPGAMIDWVVEPGFAPLVRRVDGVCQVIECGLRRWTRAWWSAGVRTEWRAFRERLQRDHYDAVLDLQGLTKSAVVARLAHGVSYGLANRTDGASFEAPARWLVDRPIRIEPHIHALDRGRELAARALGYRVAGPPQFGLQTHAELAAGAPTVALVHGTSRADKLWPEAAWVELGRRALREGWRVALPHAGAVERDRAQRIASALGEGAQVWPEMALDALVDRLGATHGVIGVDSGLSHVAVALNLPHVQIYNWPTAWRTGPQATHGHSHQVTVQGDGQVDGQADGHGAWPAPRPPLIEAVWAAWVSVRAAVPGASVCPVV
ncbi:MAG: lipopolysaccharide heptosyltransferase I [Burkholderiales bacterium]|nr:lipopolysaccharide heptosyltransferase I [Burkholderiales bacterium]MDE2298593.1 lipopolysaccharide heptosyltransferase I [Burkholderiales bacterium]MDE2627549.1 lipopolysaccharide heptosyltransferase I [Burkholderiales bacterium]